MENVVENPLGDRIADGGNPEGPRAGSHPIEPIPAGIANSRCGAGRAVPNANAESPRSAESSHSGESDLTAWRLAWVHTYSHDDSESDTKQADGIIATLYPRSERRFRCPRMRFGERKAPKVASNLNGANYATDSAFHPHNSEALAQVCR